MIGVPVPPRRVFGVHVAGWATDAVDVWVCRAHPGGDGIRIEGIEPLVELPGGAEEPATAAAAFVTKIREAPRSAWGFDVPFVGALDADDATGSDAAGPAGAGAWLRNSILEPATRLQSVCRLPLDPLPVVTADMPAAMAATAASTYLLEVSPEALRRRLAEEGMALPSIDGGDWLPALRELTAANQARPMARVWRTRVGEHAGARAALLCAIATWRGYRDHDHRRLHAEQAESPSGFVYC